MKIFTYFVYVLWCWLLGAAFARLMITLFVDEFDKKDVVSSLYQFTLAGITAIAFFHLMK